jgi:hypothetical protein
MRPAPRLARAAGVLQCRVRDVDFVASGTKRWARGTPRLPDGPKELPHLRWQAECGHTACRVVELEVLLLSAAAQ